MLILTLLSFVKHAWLRDKDEIVIDGYKWVGKNRRILIKGLDVDQGGLTKRKRF